MKQITFLTDFGTKGAFVAQMKGVVSGITDAQIIDISHEVSAQNVREGAFLLWAAAPFFPAGTIHVGVVDPGVGTERKALIVTTKKQVFVGPDNGLLMPAAHLFGDVVVYEITNPRYMIHPLSRTFHGRDIFAPVAAYIARGIPFGEIGSKTSHFVDLAFPLGENQGDRIVGKVLYVDRFGNLVTNIPQDILPRVDEGKTMTLVFGERRWEHVRFVSAYGVVPPGELLGVVGSSHFLEISVNQGDAARLLGLKADADISVEFG